MTDEQRLACVRQEVRIMTLANDDLLASVELTKHQAASSGCVVSYEARRYLALPPSNKPPKVLTSVIVFKDFRVYLYKTDTDTITARCFDKEGKFTIVHGSVEWSGWR
jgi:hypothetical protein